MEKIEQALQDELSSHEFPPPPMVEVAERLSYDPSHLYNHFPELCRQISGRYRAYQKSKSEERTRQICEEVRRAVLTLIAEGCYPGARQVARLLIKPATIREPAAHHAWKEMLKEFGLEELTELLRQLAKLCLLKLMARLCFNAFGNNTSPKELVAHFLLAYSWHDYACNYDFWQLYAFSIRPPAQIDINFLYSNIAVTGKVMLSAAAIFCFKSQLVTLPIILQ